MADQWVVHVQDTSSAAVTSATVALVRTSALRGRFPFTSVRATHTHSSVGDYVTTRQPSAAGDWTLIVRATGKTPVVQPLVLRTRRGHLSTGAADWLATVTSVTSTVGGDQVTTLTVTVHDASEYVWVGAASSSGTRFDLYADDRATELRSRGGNFNRGTLKTVFSGERQERVHSLPRRRSGFVEVATVALGGPLNITTFYKYVHDIGTSAPGRIQELGVFGHAIAGGPIINNTNDPNPSAAARDSADTDGRAKDWNSTNSATWSDMPQALASGAFFQIWGCSATDEYHRGVQQATRHSSTPNTFFSHRFTHHRHAGRDFILTSTPSLVAWDIDRQFRGLTTYASGAAAFLGVPVKAAPPGVGSALTPGSPNVMSPEARHYRDIYTFLTTTYGAAGAATSDAFDKGFVDYGAIAASQAATSLPAEHTGYHLVTIESSTVKIRLGARLRHERTLRRRTDVTSGSVRAATPPLASGVTVTDPITSGHVHVFRSPGSHQDIFYVDASDHAYTARRTTGGFEVTGQLV